MNALVTGASSGIGMEIAKYLDSLDYNLILVARNKNALEELQSKLKNKSKIIVMDLTSLDNIKSLYILTKNADIDILVNNAGFGLYGDFLSTDIQREFEMIDLNIRSLQMLTKLFLRDMVKKNKGYILNVASSASFMPGGPLMSSYYASKSYVNSLTNAIWYELRKRKSNVHISCLCPGPVDTNFNNVAGVKFSIKPARADYVAKYAINNLLKGKRVIIPGFKMKCAKFFSRFVSDSYLLRITYNIQKKKSK